MNFNKVILIGRLTHDPELRYTAKGLAVTNLRLALNRKFKSKDGDLKEETHFVSVAVWDKLAEICNKHLKKGRGVLVEGNLQSRDREIEGKKYSVLDVRADRVEFLGKDENSESQDVITPTEVAWDE